MTTPIRKRFIPAHAGNSRLAPHVRPRATVHPRACGEQSQWRSPRCREDGSSPRMRGTVHPLTRQLCLARFIPAHAGNSRESRPRLAPCPVHPRACGEQGRSIRGAYSISGSSPRMRGTDGYWRRVVLQIRFIPAHAGNRQCAVVIVVCATVHPRACGEQCIAARGAVRLCGSSPRMRGTVYRSISIRTRDRFIPAHAGNSLARKVGHEVNPVHPRACGEQVGVGAREPINRGSSPRMRGTVIDPHAQLGVRRFIPAHAGNRTYTPQ